MSSGIRLDLPRQLNGTMSMAVTNRVFQDVRAAGLEPVQIFRWLSGLDMLIFVPGREDRFSLYTRKGSFSISITDERVLLLTSYHENTLRDNNDCLRFGVTVSCTRGVYVSVKNQATGTYCAFKDGKEISENQEKLLPSANVTDLLSRCLDEQREQRHIARSPTSAAPEEHRIPEQMEEYLATAEAYAAIENDLELARAQQSGPLYYYGLDAVKGFDRQDRMAYSVRCDQLDETAYAPNTKVQLDLSGERQLGATILSVDPAPGGGYTLVLLFEDQVSRSELPSEGTIRPTFSDVQYEVRSNVIESLRQGKSKAGFLEQVLGGHQTAGFENKDLRTLDAELQKQKYPPNASQIEAIHRGINTKDILLVMGPPGTGKTTVILEWVKYFIKQEGKRVLISSQNNKAVDNVLERLTEERDISAIRAGNEAKVQANMYPYLLENRIKQLQTELERHSGENLARLERLETDYQSYGELLDRAVGDYQAIGAMAASLEREADLKCAPLIERISAAAEEEKRQRWKLDGIRNSLRIILFLMGDPDRAMVLRFLTAPFRKLLRGQAEKLLAEYEKGYAGYREIRGRWLDACRELSSVIYTDERLLDLAARQAQVEKRGTRWRSALARRPEDRDICGDLPWQDAAQPMDAAGVQALRQQLDARRQRVKGLRRAVDEWNEHIQSQSNYALSDLLLESADLVGGTCIGINSQRKFARVDFDVTIIDEAGQIQIHNALVPMSRSPKLIMLGDHKQIPPVADPEQVEMCEERDVDPSLLKASLFEALYERLPESNKIMLDTQYRMPAQLGDLLSEWFYDNKYYSFKGKREMPGVWPGLFTSPFVVVDTSGDPKRRETKLETGASNPLEAELVARIVGCMTDPRDPNALDSGKFGVISPYKAQVELLRNVIRKRTELSPEQIHEMVASLDSFQGQERKIIIYSCTRSNDRPPRAARIGFLKELRRLNVALSRPKEQLVFIGDIEFLSGCENGEGAGSEQAFSQFIQLMMKHARTGGQVMTSEELCQKTGGAL